MSVAIAVTAILALVATCVLIVWASFKVNKRRTSRNEAGRELALLADAHAVEHQAQTLLADAGDELALHDAHAAPFDMKQLGYGKGILAAKIAASQARLAIRQLEWGEDFYGARVRLNLAKKAFAIAEDMAERGKIMAAAPGRNRAPHLQEVSEWTDGSPI